jgi:hypothetical protein
MLFRLCERASSYLSNTIFSILVLTKIEIKKIKLKNQGYFLFKELKKICRCSREHLDKPSLIRFLIGQQNFIDGKNDAVDRCYSGGNDLRVIHENPVIVEPNFEPRSFECN